MLLKPKFKLFIFLTLGVLLLSACRAETPRVERASRLVTDSLGRSVSVPERVERVVSLAPNLTEIVFAVGGGERLVGVTTFCNYPEAATRIAKIGDTMTPNMEAIVALKPDIVLVSTASQIETFAKTLESNGIAVFVVDANSLEGVFANMTTLGELLSTSSAASDVVAKLRERARIVADRSRERPIQKVFVQISKEPLFTVGKESFLTQMLDLVNARSVTADVATAYPKLSKETAAVLEPDSIILSESPDNQQPNDALKASPAVKNGRVYSVSADLLSRPGPRLVDALEQIDKHLHGS